MREYLGMDGTFNLYSLIQNVSRYTLGLYLNLPLVKLKQAS
jgi:hypothetical protein